MNSSRPESSSNGLKKLHPDPRRRWEADGVRFFIRQEYEIVELLSNEYDVVDLCEFARVSRSGYYKWKKRAKEPPHARQEILDLVARAHKDHPSHGYRWVHAYLVPHNKITVSADYIRRAFNFLGIESKTGHRQKNNPRKVKDWTALPRDIMDINNGHYQCMSGLAG